MWYLGVKRKLCGGWDLKLSRKYFFPLCSGTPCPTVHYVMRCCCYLYIYMVLRLPAHVASQKEQLKGFLNDMKSLHLHRDRLRMTVGQMEKDTEEKKKHTGTDDQQFPTVSSSNYSYLVLSGLILSCFLTGYLIVGAGSRASKFWTGTCLIITIIFSVAMSTQKLPNH